MDDPTDRRPPSRRIADELRAAIVSGELVEGDQLPSERELASRYATARNTAREALGVLQAEGLAVAQQGRGVFVRQRRPLVRMGRNRYSPRARQETGLSPFRIEVERQGRTPHVECRSVTTTVPSHDVAERLGITEDENVVRRENWYFADGEAVQIGVTYIPASLVHGSPLATEKTLGPGSIYERFADLGYAIVRIREEVSARMPTPAELQGLAMPPGVPVIDVTHTSVDAAGRPFEVTRFVLRADQNGLDYEMAVQG
jgi:GntR family transcriptional regulator